MHCRLPLHGIGDMAVNIKRGCRGHMAYGCRERFHIHTVLQRHGSKGVTQIVKAHLLQPARSKISCNRFLTDDGFLGLPLSVGDGNIHSESTVSLYATRVFKSDGGRITVRIEAFCFRLRYNHLCLDDIYLPFDMQLSCFEVQVTPFECQYLTAPHSRAELQQEELIATFFLCLMQKSDNFIFA